MKITPSGATPPAIVDNGPSFQSQQQAKARAVAMLNSQASAPVSNPNQVSAEELSAIVHQHAETTDNSTHIEETAVETVTQEAPKKVEDPLTKQYALLARKEKQLRLKFQQQEQELRAQREEVRKQQDSIAARDQEYKQGYISRDQLKRAPLQVLADAGLSYEELTQQLINQQPSDPRTEATINKLQSQVDQLQRALEKSNKNYEDNQTQSYNAALNQIERDIKNLVSSDPTFETVKATNSVRDVRDLIERTWKEEGVVLSVEEAAQEVEDYLVDEALKLSRIDKIQKRLAENASKSQPKAPAQQPAAQQPKQQQPMRTLTNATSSTRPMTARERAIAAMEGKLK